MWMESLYGHKKFFAAGSAIFVLGEWVEKIDLLANRSTHWPITGQFSRPKEVIVRETPGGSGRLPGATVEPWGFVSYDMLLQNLLKLTNVIHPVFGTNKICTYLSKN